MSAPSQHSCEPEPLRRRIRTVAISNPDTGGGPEQLRELQNRRYAFASSVGELLTRAEAGQQPVQGPALYGVECDGPGLIYMLSVVDSADDGVIDGADDRGVRRPRRSSCPSSGSFNPTSAMSAAANAC